MAALILLALLVAAAAAPRRGVDSRSDFTGSPDWRNRTA